MLKKILSTTLAIVLFIGASQAQTTEEKDRRNKGERKEMAINHLNLTAEQKAKFQTIREAQRKEMQTLKSSGNVTPEQRKAIHEKYKTQYQAILTPAQQEELKKHKKERKEKGKMGQGFGKRGGKFGNQAAFWKKELALTADQETKLQTLFQDFRTKAQNIRSNNSLSQEQKKTQTKSLAQQYMAQGKAILTPEQARKFEALKDKRMNKRNSNL